ncbi:MAG: hypothetical protein M0R37_12415 [Bacteroidales bacterium]|nr:hypothetical protein [Bacteroidales bacterium]
MSAGMVYNLDPMEDVTEYCRAETIFRRTGGMSLDTTNLVLGSILPPFTPLAVNKTTRVATAVKNVKVVENAASNATAIKIAKKSLAYVGMYLGTPSKAAQVTAIDKTTSSDYDILTISLGGAVVANQILFETVEPSEAVAEVKGVYTLAIGTKPAAGDKLSLDGKEYEFAASEGDAVFAAGADAKAAAANIEDAVSAQYDGVFSVVAKNGKLIFTQLVGGVGAIPVLVVTQVAETGTLAATIAQTTAGVAAVPGANVPKNVAYGFNYAATKVEVGASVTIIGAAMEIKEERLATPVCEQDKVSLGYRYDFI